ncbi:MAG TPA: ribosome maturation factor RimM [Acidobacteriaceae bacterium]|nr:ribosome maturation factor RimM [Acidobacteriaceae bacterium]
MNHTCSWVSVARLLRPQGRHGEVLAEILTDFPERFATLREIYIKRDQSALPSLMTLEKSWLHKGRVVLKFATVDSISSAESLRGAEVVLPLPARVPLEPDAAYIDDLIGCTVVDLHGPPPITIGTIRDVIQQAQTTDLLVVVDAKGVEQWIPFARAYVVRMDLENRVLEMDLPAGLLDINAPLTEEERKLQHDVESGETGIQDAHAF